MGASESLMSKLTLKSTSAAPKRCSKQEQRFCDTVLAYYREHGRHHLPWRKTKHPYRILVSEIMLQQTQVDRVVPKYRAFLRQFPTVRALAEAPLGDVLVAWQGLGYNRRAKLLSQCAKTVVEEYGGRFPRTYDELRELPGIGSYTAAAVMAFAYNQAVPLIETNVRTVFLHHFFPKRATDVTDADILALVAKTLPAEDVRAWYAAIMDYGSYLKKTIGNANVRAKSYQKQSTFKGSDRQLRGAILRELAGGKKTRLDLHRTLRAFEDLRVDAKLDALMSEGMVVKSGRWYTLP
jgi:A/G-specific adenine glycosylase